MLDWYTKQDLMENAGFKMVGEWIQWPFGQHFLRSLSHWTAEETWNEAWAAMMKTAENCPNDTRIQAAYTATITG